MNQTNDSNKSDGAGQGVEGVGAHGGWRMALMMLLCCIPMVIIIALAYAAGR